MTLYFIRIGLVSGNCTTEQKLTYDSINLDLFDFQLLILSYDTLCYQTFLDIYAPLFLHSSIFRFSCMYSKGSLILKWFFWVINFLQKTNKRIQLYNYDTSSRLVFVVFWKKLKTPKRHFEIN